MIRHRQLDLHQFKDGFQKALRLTTRLVVDGLHRCHRLNRQVRVRRNDRRDDRRDDRWEDLNGSYGNNGGYGMYRRNDGYGYGNNGNRAEVEKGFRDGPDRGQEDARDRRRADPNNSSHYKKGSSAYREGFPKGYVQGYRQYGNSGRW